MADPTTLSHQDLDWLTALLSVPSVSPLEGGDLAQVRHAQQIVEDGARERRFVRRRLDSPPAAFLENPAVPASVRHAMAVTDEFRTAQPSLVMGYGEPQPAHRRMVINFHVDTVGPHLPPVLRDRRMSGRGTVDAKGPGIAAAVGVAAAFAAAPSLASTTEVLLASVPGEEGGAMGVYGTRWLVESGCVGRLMLFAEPTGCRVLDSCSATMTPVWEVHGDDATDDHPDAGHNATLALGLLSTYLARQLGPEAEKLGAKLCVAGVHTGTAHNRVYGSGSLSLNIAYYDSAVGDRLAQAVDDVAGAAAEYAAEQLRDLELGRRLITDWTDVVRLRWVKRGLPALANRDAGMEALLASCGLLRHDGIADGTAFTCDAIWAGGRGGYVAVCGPGRLDANGAHTADEHVDLDDLDAYATRIRDLVLEFGAHLDRDLESTR